MYAFTVIQTASGEHVFSSPYLLFFLPPLTHTHTLDHLLPLGILQMCACVVSSPIVRTLTIITLDWNWLYTASSIYVIYYIIYINSVYTCPICRTGQSRCLTSTLPSLNHLFRRAPIHTSPPLTHPPNLAFHFRYMYTFVCACGYTFIYPR